MNGLFTIVNYSVNYCTCGLGRPFTYVDVMFGLNPCPEGYEYDNKQDNVAIIIIAVFSLHQNGTF